MRFRLILLTIVVFISACGGSGSSSGSGSHEKLILVLGDSIGAGREADIAFPDLVQNQTGIPVVNASVPGTSAEEEVFKAPALIEQHNPRYIIALLGTNDALGAAGQKNGAIGAMQLLADICKENGIICIIGTLPPITLSSDLNRIINEINTGYRQIEGVRLADNNAVMNGGHIGPDGIHPNNAGQRAIADVFSMQLP